MSHHQSINRITNVIRDACKELGVSGYNERMGEGSLRYLQVNNVGIRLASFCMVGCMHLKGS